MHLFLYSYNPICFEFVVHNTQNDYYDKTKTPSIFSLLKEHEKTFRRKKLTNVMSMHFNWFWIWLDHFDSFFFYYSKAFFSFIIGLESLKWHRLDVCFSRTFFFWIPSYLTILIQSIFFIRFGTTQVERDKYDRCIAFTWAYIRTVVRSWNR